jgi:hypothetical protein
MLFFQHNEVPLLNHASIPELVALTSWYLWWECEKVQKPSWSTRGIKQCTRLLREYVNLSVDAYFDEDLLSGTTDALMSDIYNICKVDPC